MGIKHLPEMTKVNRKWVVTDFQPGPGAWDWPNYKNRTGTLYIVQSVELITIQETR